ncbi:MAG: FmdB family zinc ribbon protein [Bryobacteraceae bacterium]
MPLYEYRCSSCGAQFEQLRRMQDAGAPVACPKCQAPGAERLLPAISSHSGASPSQPASPCGAPDGACGSGRCPYQG